MELSEIKRNIDEYRNNLAQIRGLFDLENKETNIQEYEEMMTEPDFWDDQNKAQEAIDKNNALKSVVNGYHELEEEVEDMTATWELLQEELDDDVKSDLEQNVLDFKEKVDQFELQLLLDGPHDANNAILELHPVLEVLNHKTGLVCYYVCTNVMVNNKGSKLKLLIIYQVMKRASKVSHC